jgi:hypothetical protein
MDTTEMKATTLISIFFLVGLFQPLLSQEQPLKDYAEEKRERKFCLYASTLRMINISQNEDYNEMVNGVEKLLIYKLDSTARTDKSYKEMLVTYQENGFEEYMAMYGGKTQMYLYGKEKKKDSEYVGVFREDEMAIAFYLRGQIGWNKIPDLIKSFQADDMLNVLDFKTENFGNNPHNK